MAHAEAGRRIETSGSTVPIIQHNCLRGSYGLLGKPTKYRWFTPIAAECVDCHKEIKVNVPAWHKGILSQQTKI